MSDDKDLLKFLNKVGVTQKFRIEENLGSGYVRLNIEESQRRQAKHDIRSVEDAVIELVRNSRDAGAKNILVASRLRNNIREIWVIDDGEGIPLELHKKIFEARVTSKVDKIIEDDYGVHGRGMALFAINSRCKEAVVSKSEEGKLTVVKIASDINELPERSDQSTLPKVKRVDGKVEFSGAVNVPRILTEFASKSPQVEFFYGLPSQIAATLIKLAKKEKSFSGFNSNDVDEFCKIFNSYFGFTLSKRNAYRCLSGELNGVNLRLYYKNAFARKANLKQKSFASMIKISELEPIMKSAAKDLEEIAEKYNLTVVDGKIVKKGNAIKILLALAKDEDI
jgi:hypothetical protein